MASEHDLADEKKASSPVMKIYRYVKEKADMQEGSYGKKNKTVKALRDVQEYIKHVFD
jgi:hypothetical protein